MPEIDMATFDVDGFIANEGATHRRCGMCGHYAPKDSPPTGCWHFCQNLVPGGIINVIDNPSDSGMRFCLFGTLRGIVIGPGEWFAFNDQPIWWGEYPDARA